MAKVTHKLVKQEETPGMIKVFVELWAGDDMTRADWSLAASQAMSSVTKFSKGYVADYWLPPNMGMQRVCYMLFVQGDEWDNFEHDLSLLHKRNPSLGITVTQVTMCSRSLRRRKRMTMPLHPLLQNRPENPRKALPSSWCLHNLGDGITAFLCLDQFEFTNSEEYWELMQWLYFHGLDPTSIPMDEYIYRNEILHTITTIYYERDENGRLVVEPVESEQGAKAKTFIFQEQGEAGPLPWPAILGEPESVDRCRCPA
jgi:hypothetical protein